VGAGITTVGAEGLEPMTLFKTYFYTDSIRDKPVQMLNSNVSNRAENDDQDQFSPCQSFTHDGKYPFIHEFSEFISGVSMKALKYQLMTHPQRILAQALWEANNYGGSKEKCIKHLKEIYGPSWHKMTTIKDHMEDFRPYCEFVLLLEHRKQWDERKKLAKLQQTHDSQCS
jgi:hypothetical protein